MYDAVAEALPLAQAGRHRKKALLIISDGNDTSSRTDVLTLKRLIRETEVLVYAIGIDSQAGPGQWPRRYSQGTLQRRPQPPPRVPTPFPFPFPGRRPPPPSPPIYPPQPGPRGNNTPGTRGDEGVNVAALRDITDDSGGRTEIVRSPGDLAPATAGIADELSKQVLPGIRVDGRQGRALAHDPRRGPAAELHRARAAGVRGYALELTKLTESAEILIPTFSTRRRRTEKRSKFRFFQKAFSVPPLLRCSCQQAVKPSLRHLRYLLFSARGAPPPLARAAALEDSLSSRGPQALCAIVAACDFTRPRSA